MIKGIGIDLIEIERIAAALKKRSAFKDRVLTKEEVKVFNQLPNAKRRHEYLAGRFAAKEAFAKASGRGIGRLSFQDIEILSKSSGAPEIKVKGYDDLTLFVSIAHSESHAVAQIIISEKDEGK